MKKFILPLLIVLSMVNGETAATAANRINYPHVGEVVGYSDPDKWIGSRSPNRPHVMLLGDSITYRAIELKLNASRPGWEKSAVPGRDIGNFEWYIDDRLKSPSRLDVFILALGTNATESLTYNQLRDGLAKVRARGAKVVLVNGGRYGSRYSDANQPYRGRDSSVYRYAGWFEIMNQHPRTCVARWRQKLWADPTLASDGVHPNPGRGVDTWVGTVLNTVKACS